MIWFTLWAIKRITGLRWPHWLYLMYLRSPKWHHKRQLAIKRACEHCELCYNYANNFEVHHDTYLNLGNEAMHELFVLCPECHKNVHNIKMVLNPSKERVV